MRRFESCGCACQHFLRSNERDTCSNARIGIAVAVNKYIYMVSTRKKLHSLETSEYSAGWQRRRRGKVLVWQCFPANFNLITDIDPGPFLYKRLVFDFQKIYILTGVPRVTYKVSKLLPRLLSANRPTSLRLTTRTTYWIVDRLAFIVSCIWKPLIQVEALGLVVYVTSPTRKSETQENL